MLNESFEVATVSDEPGEDAIRRSKLIHDCEEANSGRVEKKKKERMKRREKVDEKERMKMRQ